MDEEDPRPRKSPARADPGLAGQDLSALSVAELEERIVALQAEMERCRAAIAKKQGVRSAADELFRR